MIQIQTTRSVCSTIICISFKQNSKPCDHYVSNDQKRIRHSNAQQERKSQIWCSDLSISISCCLNLKFPAFTVV
ncbi:hypothetical protein DsansV1_C05g0052551 [Dioscorea sansibarensis]